MNVRCLLNIPGRPPGPEMENAVNRESYSLAAGLALGLVMLQVVSSYHLKKYPLEKSVLEKSRKSPESLFLKRGTNPVHSVFVTFEESFIRTS